MVQGVWKVLGLTKKEMTNLFFEKQYVKCIELWNGMYISWFLGGLRTFNMLGWAENFF